MKVLMLTLILVVLSAVSATSPRGSQRRGSPGGPAPATSAPSPAPAPAPGASPFQMSPPAPPRRSSNGRGAPSPPGRPNGPPSPGGLPHGIPQPPATPGRAPPQGQRDQATRDPRVPIMPPGTGRGNAPGSGPRPADTPDPEDQASREAMPERCTEPGAMVRSPMSCSTYYVCAAGGINHMRHCPDPLHFDPAIKVCNWPRAVNCVLPTTTTQEPSTRPPVEELPEFDEDCKDEIVIRTKKLDNGMFLVFQCSPGFGYFPLNVDCDRTSRSCKFPIKATPPNPGLPLPMTTVNRLMSDNF